MSASRVRSFVLASFVRLLHATLRVTHVGAEKVDAVPQYIISFWHEHLLLMLHSKYRRPVRVLSSRSRDGDLSAGVFAHYGIDVSRGSNSSGGTAALRAMILAGRSGSNIVFTPDGPRGPRRIVKEGVVYAAQATGLPVIPFAFAAKKKSGSDRGTAWSCRIRSRARRSCMAIRSRSRAMKMSNRRDCASNGR